MSTRQPARLWLICLGLLLPLSLTVPASASLPPTISYTGQLLSGSSPVSGTYDFQFSLYTAPTGGTQVGYLLTVTSVPVADGVFYVELGFGNNVFTGQKLFLQTAYRVHPASGNPGYTLQSVRKLVPTSGYANYATLSSSTQGLQGFYVSKAPPTNGQVLTYSGSLSEWLPMTLPTPPAYTAGDGLSLSGTTFSVVVPLNLNGNDNRTIVSATNSSNGDGVDGLSATGDGVYGYNTTDANSGTLGDASGDGVYGNGNDGGAFYGSNIGVYGNGSGDGGDFYGGTGYGVYGYSESSDAGYFNGNVVITGSTSMAAPTARIDHPLDPENKYLTHASIESDEMKDIYDGTVTLDAQGMATVTMPDWFQALNTNFRYQLTAIGAPGPNLYIAQEITGNKFQIAGGQPGSKVSWQVTGVRHDAFALAHPLQVEQDKPEKEQGLYQNPEAFGLPPSAGIGYAKQQKIHDKN